MMGSSSTSKTRTLSSGLSTMPPLQCLNGLTIAWFQASLSSNWELLAMDHQHYTATTVTSHGNTGRPLET